MQNNHIYDYIIIGAGISGSSIAYELNKHSKNILILEKQKNIADAASGAAGGFLSPLMGKPNKFKDLINSAFDYSTNFYKTNMPNLINQCGTLRLAKNEYDKKKFDEYEKYISYKYKKEKNAFFFYEASVVKSREICISLASNINIQFECKVESLKFVDKTWIINDNYCAKKVILANGVYNTLIDEFYLGIRPVWGQRIEISTTSSVNHNYHKECSVSLSSKINKQINSISIGATHHRFVKHKKIVKSDTQLLLKKAHDIIQLKDIKVINEYAGARSSSSDYFPLLGEIIDSSKTLREFPYIKKGTKIPNDRYTKYKNLYIINGLGGRGFVLAPYLAKQLSNYLINNVAISEELQVNRLFNRAVRKL